MDLDDAECAECTKSQRDDKLTDFPKIPAIFGYMHRAYVLLGPPSRDTTLPALSMNNTVSSFCCSV